MKPSSSGAIFQSLGRAPLQLMLVGLLLVGALALPSQASSLTPPPPPTVPLTALQQAQTELTVLTGSADPAARAELSAAIGELANATTQTLWPSQNEAVPPPYGDQVFAASEAALQDLSAIHNDASVPTTALNAAIAEIVEGCGALAAAAAKQVGLRGGQPIDTAISADQSLYDRAFQALGAEITAAITHVPQQITDQSAETFLQSPSDVFSNIPAQVSGPPLTIDGEPELYYYGAEFCPFCAVQRWSMVEALAQFGEFSPLALTESSDVDYAPATNTVTFSGSTYESPLIAFVPDEAYSNVPDSSTIFGYANLQPPTAAQEQLLAKYDQAGGFPFLDLGNDDTTYGSYLSPTLLSGLSWSQIAAAMQNPGSSVGEGVAAGAELLAAQICTVTHERPANVCDDSVNRAYQHLLATLPTAIDNSSYLTSLSCPSTSLCVAVDEFGNVVISDDPGAATPTWSAPTDVDGTNVIWGVSCPSTSLCVAVDSSGNVLVSRDPASRTPTWSAPISIDGTNSIYSISCPSTSLCVAVDADGNAVISYDPGAATPIWTAPADVDGTVPLEAISCPSSRLCAAVDGAGNVVISHDPTAATPTWSAPADIDGTNEIYSISCPSASLCVAVDVVGNVIISHDPTSATPVWSAPADVDGANAIYGVSCPSTSLCVAVDSAGDVLVSQDPTAATPTWSTPAAITSKYSPTLTAVSCESIALCVAVDYNGHSYVSDDPAAAEATWNGIARSS